MCYKQNEYPLLPVSVISKNDLLPDIMRCQRQELPGNTFRAIKALTKFARVLPSVVEVGGTQGLLLSQIGECLLPDTTRTQVDALILSWHPLGVPTQQERSPNTRSITSAHRGEEDGNTTIVRDNPTLGMMLTESLVVDPNSSVPPFPNGKWDQRFEGSHVLIQRRLDTPPRCHRYTNGVVFEEYVGPDSIHDTVPFLFEPRVSHDSDTELTAKPPIDGSFPLLNNISLVTDLEFEGGCHRPISTFCGCAMAKSEPYRIECIALQMVYLLSTPFYGKAVTLGRGGNDPDQWLTATLGYPT
ncbi:hypothetical protein BKA82DRAFT_10643 [Pisolithus tinctorius]|uniref:Uncharacterized protein n=1 Tax=Pisolithus tinctorius Marx 270 TaxID=870435 RepID=A0A0C3NS39_PISTI|nr:hypothetical protein BKA82DRAFT_10643 [Pisolithus tinctorius]KIN98108.1 hypothetical protein M404DRAFT_10643 [Pisolithus tinctorius Marx 270]